MDFIQELYKDMQQNELPCSNPIIIDGKIHRYGKEGINDQKDEWYCIFQTDKGYIAVYGSWSTSQKFKYSSYTGTSTELESFYKQIEAKVKSDRELRQREKEADLKRIKEEILTCTVNTVHPYLTKKQINHEHLQLKDELFLLLRDSENEVVGAQTISVDGDKKFRKGTFLKGNFIPFGLENPEKIYISEGYATAYTIHSTTKQPAVAALSLSNIIPVTENLVKKYPHAKLFLCQDVGEQESIEAEKWKKKFNGIVIKPPIQKKGYDFNDYYCEFGEKTLKTLFEPPQFSGISLVDLLTISLSPTKWLLNNLLVAGGSLLMHASGGVGKSWLALEMSLALAEGTFWGVNKVLEPQDILYIDAEMPLNQLQERVKKIINRRKSEIHSEKFTILNSFELMRTKQPKINLYDPSVRERINNMMHSHDVLFLDNFQNLAIDVDFVGMENKAEYWQILSDWLKELKLMGKSIILIHHEGKNGTLRGTSRMNGDFDTLVKLEKPAELPETGFKVVVHPYKIRQADQKYERPYSVHIHESFLENKFGWFIETDLNPKKEEKSAHWRFKSAKLS